MARPLTSATRQSPVVSGIQRRSRTESDPVALLVDRQRAAQAREVVLNPAQAAAIADALATVPAHVPTADAAVAETELVIAARTLLPRDLRRLGRAVINRLDTDGPPPADTDPADPTTAGGDDASEAARLTETLWWTPGSVPSPNRTAGAPRRVTGLRFGGFLTAENAELFQTLIDAAAKPRKTPEGELDPRTLGQRRADAFAIVLRAAAATGGEIPSHGGIKPHLSVTIPFSTLSALPTFNASGTAATESPLALPTNHGRPPIATSARLAMPTGTSIPTDMSIPLGLEATNLASTAIDLNMGPPATASVGANSAADSGVSPRGATAVAVGIATAGLGSGPSGGGLVFGDPLSVSEVRRIACDTGIIPIVLGAQGEPLDVGREQRLVTSAMRRALIARDGGCVIPGCGAPPGHCDAHHLVHWADGGITAVTNLALVCAPHHRAIHRGVWTVTIVDGQVHISRPAWTEPGPSG